MTLAVSEQTLAEADLEAVLRPRTGLVVERPLGAGRFDADSGPFRRYRRAVVVERLPGGRVHVRQTVDFELAIPYWSWLFVVPIRKALSRPLPRGDGSHPWWAPPDHMDARAASVLGVLAAASLVTGYLGTLITQTITFAADEFGASDTDQGIALASVRVGVLLALVFVALSDRRGRRRVLVLTAAAGCVAAATGAAAPSLAWLAASQTVARAFSISLAILVGIVAAEEMPAGARAYAVSILSMAAALGAGICVMALGLADLDESAWRVLYLLPLLGLPLVRGVARRLPESKRYGLPHAETTIAGHRARFWLLAASGFLLALFTAPASQFQNEFLRDERDFSAARISLFTILTNTPGGIGIVVGGRLADVRGRRRVGAIALIGGTGATVAMYATTGWPLWGWSVAGAVVGAAAVPALGVYGPELFPTSLRGRANGALAVLAVAGSSSGLVAAGLLSDGLGSFAPAFVMLAAGPLLVALLVLLRYPETAHLELEQINPEDRPPPAPSTCT